MRKMIIKYLHMQGLHLFIKPSVLLVLHFLERNSSEIDSIPNSHIMAFLTVYDVLCYAIIELTLIGLKQPLVTNQSQARRLDTLSQHAQ